MKKLSRWIAIPLLALGLGLPASGCIFEVDTPNNAVEPVDGDGLEIEGEGRIDD